MAKLGNLIKNKRESEGLSLREFSERCNLSHSFIKKLEDGDPRTGKQIGPTMDSLEKLAPALNISLEDLLIKIGYIQDESRKLEHTNFKIMHMGNSFEDSHKDSHQNPKEFPSHVKENDLKYFISDPQSMEYLELAQELFEKKIKVKAIRNLLFKE